METYKDKNGMEVKLSWQIAIAIIIIYLLFGFEPTWRDRATKQFLKVLPKHDKDKHKAPQSAAS